MGRTTDTKAFARRRREMVKAQIGARGIRDAAILDALASVPREEFLPPELVGAAYEDRHLPLAEGRGLSRPYLLARALQALELTPRDRVLEVGTGSGYEAAVLSRLCGAVFTVELHRELAEAARGRLRELDFPKVSVRWGEAHEGWSEHAPFDAILLSTDAPRDLGPLLDQLAVGGRLVRATSTALVRLRRTSATEFRREDLGPALPPRGMDLGPQAPEGAGLRTARLIRQSAEALGGERDLEGLLDRIGDARVVLLGEATHGTAEFYELRARITRELVVRKGFRIVAAEADWPDAAVVDRAARPWLPPREGAEPPFTRFPTWMWRNAEFQAFTDWMRSFNEAAGRPDPVRFYGLDLYSLHRSIAEVLRFLGDRDPELAREARRRYACLSPWEGEPAAYGAAVLSRRWDSCEAEALAMLTKLLQAPRARTEDDDEDARFEAQQNARVVAGAEAYYRTMYHGARASWNLRDTHMAETLEAVLERHGPGSRAVVWAHNSHLGDASHTEMSLRGEHNLGQLARRRLGRDVYILGFGTHTGTVAAADDWDEPVRIKPIVPSRPDSYERLGHDAGLPAYLLPLRTAEGTDLHRLLLEPRLERAIGVVYRPDTELQSHYFLATLPRQFDEWAFLDETHAVTPLEAPQIEPEAETFPFGV